jgi:hypothetical protein
MTRNHEPLNHRLRNLSAPQELLLQGALQESNLNAPMRVLQLKLPVAA